jgi:hypothetical protein
VQHYAGTCLRQLSTQDVCLAAQQHGYTYAAYILVDQ